MIMAPRYHIITISVPLAVTGLYLCFVAEVVPFDEIAAYRSDPRHVTELMSLSGGLGVAITAGTHGCDVFLEPFTNATHSCGSEVGTNVGAGRRWDLP